MAGSVALEGDSGLLVFDFGRHNRLSFALVDNDIVLLNVKLSTYGGEPVLDVVDGYIRQRDEDITLETRPGHVRIPGSINDTRFVSDWARTSLLLEDLHYGMSGLPLLDLEVTRPGVVRVRGVWIDDDRGVVITGDRLSTLSRQRPKPITFMGDGEESVLHFQGLLGTAAFGV